MRFSVDEMLSSHGTRRAAIVGILNVTPDSFSDGGQFLAPADARARAERLVADGAHVLDVGAESTRPGSRRVEPAEQIARLRDVLPAVCGLGAPVSIDTTRAEVAAFALDAGAKIVNDVSAGRDDPELLPLVARHGAAVVLMHMLGTPKTMQENPRYDDVVAEVREFLARRIAAAEDAGVHRERIVIDPGIGFGKLLEHNILLLQHMGDLCSLGLPVLVGPSRKRFIGELTGESEPAQRVPGTIAACLAARRGGAGIFRVHDVKELAQALAVDAAVAPAGEPSETPTGSS